MKKLNKKDIFIISILILIIISCSFIYIFKNNNLNNSKENIDKLNYSLDIKNELLTLMKAELSYSWHRYYDWENKLDNNPYIVCSNSSKLVASIRHEEYGDIYFLFYKTEGKYYVKDYGNKIIDWQNSCIY